MRALLVAAVMVSMAPAISAQNPTSSAPSGNRIVAGDGDVVIVDHDARVSIVRRREASVRIVHNAAERWLLLLVDDARPGAPADGRVDFVYTFTDVEGDWPFGSPWNGAATIEDYSTPGRSSVGVGIATPRGLVQLLGSRSELRDATAVAVLTRWGGGSMGTMGDPTFDEAERWYSAELRRNDGVMRSPGGATVSGSLSVGVASGLSGAVGSGVRRAPNGAVRVGGSIRPPVKVVDVPPVRPEMAVRGNVRGIVIVEVTIDVDGTVKDARVLRSIPLLDAAALEAVRQWRYEATTIDGGPVPVIMTVSVSF